MINKISWTGNTQELNFFKLIDPKYDEIESISAQFNLDIDILMESYDLEQYPYIQKIAPQCLSVILDVPITTTDINLFTVPMHFILVNNNLIIIMKKSSQEIELIDQIIIDHNKIEEAFFGVLNYVSSLYLVNLKNIKKRLDYIMNQVYEKNNFAAQHERDVQRLNIVLTHYMSSLDTNNMVTKQISEIMKQEITQDFIAMKIDVVQAYDICKLYLTLNKSLFEYFKFSQDKVLTKKINRLTALTISLTIPNMVFGFYGMNVNLPFATIANVWIIITICVVVVAIIVYYLTKIDN